MRRLSITGVAGAAVVIAGVTLADPAGASRSSVSVSFASDTTSSAGWCGHGHSAICLTIGSGPSSSVFAAVVLHHISSSLPSTSPTFTTDNYNSGSPRWYIPLTGGAYLFGYPSNPHLNGNDFAWSVNNCPPVNSNTYMGYSDAVAAVNSSCPGSVTGAEIIADGDQAAGTTDTITGLQYGG
ncbi:MAG: hypothetical protein ACREN2_10065 [Candidatus Dormibacteria bacterium]